jgi:2-polyprenyl-6-methoxyphenol hydroxylase-like FAD-dependent oxidoreductase
MTDSDLLPQCAIARRHHLAAEYRAAFPDQLSAPLFARPLALRDARTTCRRRLWTGRWLPIGDALASIDPLTGAGLERAFGAAERGAELVSDYLTSHSFRRLELAARDTALTFQAALGELRRYYRMAFDHKPQLTGLFWQRRSNFPGYRNSLWP